MNQTINAPLPISPAPRRSAPLHAENSHFLHLDRQLSTPTWRRKIPSLPQIDAAAVSLLRSLRAGTVDRRYVHRVDVCAAAPEDLVANLEPVPGTDLAGDGYSMRIWYLYCPKRYKNTQGKASGHRHRSIAGGDSSWHSETRPKPVKGLDGATLCTLSYGRKDGSSRSFNRMGWCMAEYDVTQGGEGGHVLCKVYRSSSSLAGKKLKTSPSSSKTAPSEKTSQSSSGSKRKATADDPVETRPTKISHKHHAQEQQFCVLDHEEQFDFDPMSLLEDDQETIQEDHQEHLVYDPTLSLADDGQETMPVDDQELFDFDPMRLLEEDEPEFPNNGVIHPETLAIYNELVRICCGPSTEVAPPNAASFEPLAF